MFYYGKNPNILINENDILDFTNQWNLEQFQLNKATLADLGIIKIVVMTCSVNENLLQKVWYDQKKELSKLQAGYLRRSS